MGCSPKINSSSESTKEMLGAYKEYLPSLTQAVNEQLLPTAQAQQAADEALAPRRSQLEYDIASQYLPKYTQLGNELGQQQSLGNVASDTAALNAAGQEGGLVDKALALEKSVDPEYYATRGALAGGLQDLIKSINPNGLTGSESEEINRNLARSGTGAPSSSRAITNAQQFGSKLDQKKQLFGQALNSASAALPSLKTGFDPYKVATGKDSRANTGLGAFNTAGQGFGQQANATSNNFLGMVNQAQLQKNQQMFAAPTGLDKANKAIGMFGNLIGSVAGAAMP